MRALESDTVARESNLEQLIGLLLLRQATCTSAGQFHPHLEVIKASRQSARDELMYRIDQLNDSLQQAHRDTERVDWLQKAIYQEDAACQFHGLSRGPYTNESVSLTIFNGHVTDTFTQLTLRHAIDAASYQAALAEKGKNEK